MSPPRLRPAGAEARAVTTDPPLRDGSRLPDHWTWRTGPQVPGAAAIVDVDGVLSDASHRQWHLDGPVRDWNGFFAAAVGDRLLTRHAELVRDLDEVLQVVLLTARPFRLRQLTLDWIERHGLRWDLLALRGPAQDMVHSVRFKRQALGLLRSFGFVPAFAVEDDPRIVEMYAAESLPCLYVHSGYYG
ncbi:MAG: hypothetical protein OXG69_12730 [bacterium]|nr:hypothetical protein [bacterium]